MANKDNSIQILDSQMSSEYDVESIKEKSKLDERTKDDLTS